MSSKTVDTHDEHRPHHWALEKFSGFKFSRRQSSRLECSHLLVRMALNLRMACIHKSPAAVSSLFRNTVAGSLSWSRTALVDRPSIGPTTGVSSSSFPLLSFCPPPSQLLYFPNSDLNDLRDLARCKPSREVVRAIKRVYGNADSPTLPVLPMVHINVAPCSTHIRNINIVVDDWKTIQRRWLRDRNHRSGWLPEPSSRALPALTIRGSTFNEMYFSVLLGDGGGSGPERSLVIPQCCSAFAHCSTCSLDVADAFGASNFGLGLALELCAPREGACTGTVLGISLSD